ncbi:MAG: hypothetical protein DRO88_03245 [Promethearchaeia archaeon]|nr:MAG: hypothetical protein DRO88_03245 [Candidatus Lokiarchaeia archaeon]
MSTIKTKKGAVKSAFGFCPVCGNILLPKRRTQTLYCKICNKEYPMTEEMKQYKKVERNKASQKKKEKKQVLKTPIIEESEKKPSISEDERDAFEDLFEATNYD